MQEAVYITKEFFFLTANLIAQLPQILEAKSPPKKTEDFELSDKSYEQTGALPQRG